MKHVFLVHSNTVLLSSLGVIDYEKIDNDNIIFVYGRGFSTTLVKNISSVDLSAIYNIGQTKGFVLSKSKKIKLWNYIDNFIDNNIEDNFIVYAPHTGAPFFQAFFSNVKCTRIRLIQEGAYSFYGANFNKPFFVHLKNLLFSNKRLWWQSNWAMPWSVKKRYLIDKTYALTKEYFDKQKCNEHVIIRWPSLNSEITLPEGTNMFVFDAAIELFQCEREVYLQGCEMLIAKSMVDRCFYKFHPNQSDDTKKFIIDCFARYHVYAEEFLCDTPFELVLSNSPKINLYGSTTSLLKYGENFGHNVYRFTDFLLKNSKKFSYYYKSLN